MILLPTGLCSHQENFKKAPKTKELGAILERGSALGRGPLNSQYPLPKSLLVTNALLLPCLQKGTGWISRVCSATASKLWVTSTPLWPSLTLFPSGLIRLPQW